MAALFLSSYKWKRPDRWSWLKVKENMLTRLKWHSAGWNPHSRIIPSTLLVWSYPQGCVKGKEGVTGLCSIHPPSQHARQGFSFGTHSRKQPLFPCRKCTQTISASNACLRFLKLQTSNSNKVLYTLLPRKLAWKETAGEWTVLVKRTVQHKSSLVITTHVCKKTGCTAIWVLNQPDRNPLSDKTTFLYW